MYTYSIILYNYVISTETYNSAEYLQTYIDNWAADIRNNTLLCQLLTSNMIGHRHSPSYQYQTQVLSLVLETMLALPSCGLSATMYTKTLTTHNVVQQHRQQTLHEFLFLKRIIT